MFQNASQITFFSELFQCFQCRKYSKKKEDPSNEKSYKSYAEIVFRTDGTNIMKRRKTLSEDKNDVWKYPESARSSTNHSLDKLVPALNKLRQDFSDMRLVFVLQSPHYASL